jgi:HTH-type transcriptional regulator, competence development regulator
VGTCTSERSAAVTDEAIGPYLKGLREDAGLTLRHIESRCGISNGYLSLLEHGKVKEPSPKGLWSLAECYGVDYLDLMRRAGYPVPRVSTEAQTPGFAFRGTDRLSDSDREEIQEIIAMKLRRMRRQG